jgi:hypothetical protein
MPNEVAAKPAFIETKMQSTPEAGVKLTLYRLLNLQLTNPLLEPAGIVPAICLVNLDSQSLALAGITDSKEVCRRVQQLSARAWFHLRRALCGHFTCLKHRTYYVLTTTVHASPCGSY